MADKPKFLWWEYNIDASTGNTAQVNYSLIATTDITQFSQVTVYRVICKFRPVNGATINNTVKAGIVKVPGVGPVPTGAPMDGDGFTSTEWMATGLASHPSAAGAMVEIELDTSTRRVLDATDSLYLIVDDVQGDWDMIGGGARILLRVD